MRGGELVFYAISQPYLVIYGGQFPQLDEQVDPGSEPAILPLATDTYLSWDSNPNQSGERRVLSRRATLSNHSVTEVLEY